MSVAATPDLQGYESNPFTDREWDICIYMYIYIYIYVCILIKKEEREQRLERGKNDHRNPAGNRTHLVFVGKTVSDLTSKDCRCLTGFKLLKIDRNGEPSAALSPMRRHDHLEFHATSVVGFSRADRVKPGTNVPQRASFLFRNSPELSSVRNASDGSRVLGALLCTSAALSLVRRLSLHFQLVCPSLHSAVVFTATLATVVSAPVLVSRATTATMVIAQWTVKHLSMRA